MKEKINYYLVHIPLSDVINASVLNELMKVIEGIGRGKEILEVVVGKVGKLGSGQMSYERDPARACIKEDFPEPGGPCNK